MEVEVALRVAPPPRGCERDYDPTDVPRSHVHVERDPGAVALRVEAVGVPDVRGGLARIGGAAAMAVAEWAWRFRRMAAVCMNAPRANTPRPTKAAVKVETTCKRYRPRASRSPPIAAVMIPMMSST